MPNDDLGVSSGEAEVRMLDQLAAWLSEEGIETGARCVDHMEFDCNWGRAGVAGPDE